MSRGGGGGSTQPLTEMSTRNLPAVKGGRQVRLTLQPSVTLDVSEPCGLPLSFTGIALLITLPYTADSRLSGVGREVIFRDIQYKEHAAVRGCRFVRCINIAITILDIIHRPVFYLKLNSKGWSVPHRKHITSPLQAKQVNALYRFVTIVC
jgi:hypothetical protein